MAGHLSMTSPSVVPPGARRRDPIFLLVYYGIRGMGVCGRFSLALDLDDIGRFVPFSHGSWDWRPRFNVAPGESIVIMAPDPRHPGRLRAGLASWGLVPRWSPAGKTGLRPINARAETIAVQPVFRAAFRNGRCLVPADSYYEWGSSGGQRVPYRILRQDRALLWLAAVFDVWQSPDTGAVSVTAAIVTRPAMMALSALHDRMPLILPEAAKDAWISGSIREATSLISAPWPDPGVLEMYPVSPRLNRAGTDGPELHRPWSKSE